MSFRSSALLGTSFGVDVLVLWVVVRPTGVPITGWHGPHVLVSF